MLPLSYLGLDKERVYKRVVQGYLAISFVHACVRVLFSLLLYLMVYTKQALKSLHILTWFRHFS